MTSEMASSRSYLRLCLLFVIFFVVSLLTNIIGPLVPDIIKSFHLSLTMAAFLPFSFFIAYAVMSIPSGMIIEKWGEKPVLIGAFMLALVGSIIFSAVPTYLTAMLSLFLIGLGMASIQVAINPLCRVAGGEENFAFNAVLAQLIFGTASFISPLLYSHFVTDLQGTSQLDGVSLLLSRVVPKEFPWTSMYWIFSAVTILMIVMITLMRFPRVERKEDEKSGAIATHVALLKMPTVWLYFIGIFAYVGVEQGLANWMSEFLSTEHGFDPQTVGATAVSHFWGLMTVGCALGLVLLKFFDSKKVLMGFGALSFVVLTLALFGPKDISLTSFAVMGFSISVMWSVIFALALNSIDKNHGTFSGILCTGVMGGAIVPLLIGTIGDHVGLRFGLCLVYIPLAYIFSMAFWAKPLVQNKTVEWSSTETTPIGDEA